MFEKIKNNAEESLGLNSFQRKDSGWHEYESLSGHIHELPNLENANDLVEYIMNQFKMTSNQNLDDLKMDLLIWVDEMKNLPTTDVDPEAIRDFIYEMF